MIEMRIIKHEEAPLEVQYRYMTPISGDYHGVREWSEWETAPYVTSTQVEIATMFQDWS